MRNFLIIFFFILTIVNLNSQTVISGGIHNDTTLAYTNSPYIVTDDLVLFPEHTMTIEKGVELRFEQGVSFEVRGILNAIGTKEDSIVFTTNLDVNGFAAWKGIKIMNELGAAADFKFCKFSHAFESNSAQCCHEGGPINYSNCVFKRNSFAMIGYTGDWNIMIDSCSFIDNKVGITGADKTITNNLFYGNNTSIEGSRLIIDNCEFRQNGLGVLCSQCVVQNSKIIGNVVGIEQGKYCTINNNNILKNKIGLEINVYDNEKVKIVNNKICDNSEFNVKNLDEWNRDLTSNCWCTTDETLIDLKIWDGYDNVDLGLVSYDTNISCFETCVSFSACSQAEIDDYFCERLDEFKIDSFDCTDINSLTNLKYLKEANKIYIQSKLDATSINFERLESVTEIYISSNNLTLLKFPSLKKVKKIYLNCPKLRRLTGINADSIESITLSGIQDSLFKIDGLNNLNFVDTLIVKNCQFKHFDIHFANSPFTVNNIELSNTKNVEKLSFLNDIEKIQSIAISNCSGFNFLNLSPINYDSIKIQNLSQTSHLLSLNKIEKINYLLIENNNTLLELRGLENIKTIGSLNIINNEKLFSIEQLSNLSECSQLKISGNPELNTCCSINDLLFEEIPSEVTIINNDLGCSNEQEINIFCTSNTIEKESLDLIVYPNPFYDNLYFELDCTIISIINLNGQLINFDVISSNQIKVETNKPGLYYIIIQDHNRKKTVKPIFRY